MWRVSISLSCFEREENDVHGTLSSLLRFRQVALTTIPSSFHLLPTVRLSTCTCRGRTTSTALSEVVFRVCKKHQIIRKSQVSKDGLRASNFLFFLEAAAKLFHHSEFVSKALKAVATQNLEWTALLSNGVASSLRDYVGFIEFTQYRS